MTRVPQNDRWPEYVASHAGLLSGKANSGRNGIFERISEHATKRNTKLSLYEDCCWWRIMKIEKMIRNLGQQLQHAAPPWELACMHLHMVGWVLGPCWAPCTHTWGLLLGPWWVPCTWSGSSPWPASQICLIACWPTLTLPACEQQEETKAAPNYQFCFEFISKSTDKSLEILATSYFSFKVVWNLFLL